MLNSKFTQLVDGTVPIQHAGMGNSLVNPGLVAEETQAHPEYVNALIAASAAKTVYTKTFTVDWPDAPHRVLQSAVETAQAFPGDMVGEGVGLYTDAHYPIHRCAVDTNDNGVTGTIGAMALMGERVSWWRDEGPAGRGHRTRPYGQDPLAPVDLSATPGCSVESMCCRPTSYHMAVLRRDHCSTPKGE